MLAANHRTGRSKVASTANHVSRSRARMERATKLLKNSGTRVDRSAHLVGLRRKKDKDQ